QQAVIPNQQAQVLADASDDLELVVIEQEDASEQDAMESESARTSAAAGPREPAEWPQVLLPSHSPLSKEIEKCGDCEPVEPTENGVEIETTPEPPGGLPDVPRGTSEAPQVLMPSHSPVSE